MMGAMRLLLILTLLVGCRSERPAEETFEEEERPDIDSVGDRGHPIPFGVALSVAEDEAQLLYPNLLAAAASPTELLGALPTTAGGLTRMETQTGIQEDEHAAWIGAMATYRGPGGKVTVLVQDTGWEPAIVNRLTAAWKDSTGSLPDGRKIAALSPEERGGLFLQVAADPSRPRIVLQAQANEGVDRDVLLDVLADVDVNVLKPLLERSAPFPRSPLLPGKLDRLANPKKLLAALPDVDGATEVFSGSGWHREQRSDVVAVAMRTFLVEGSVLQLSLRDLGLPGRGVTVGDQGDLEGTGAEIRRGAKGGVRCDPEMGACKAVELIADRYVWSVVGSGDRASVEAVVGALVRADLP
jgi:hypothetical protein